MSSKGEYEDLIKIMRSLMEMLTWRSVEDSMPPMDEQVLTCSYINGARENTRVGVYTGGGWDGEDCNLCDSTPRLYLVTHWMPIPEMEE